MYDGRATVLPDTLLLPGIYAVLFRSGREIYVGNTGMPVPVAAFPAALANTGKSLQLVNSAGIVVDAVSYAEAQAACSWERSKTGAWYLSNDIRGGTPGAANSPEKIPSRPEESGDIPNEDWVVYEKDIIFNEILPEPFSDGNEYIELYNRSGRPLRLIALSIAIRRADGELYTPSALTDITETLPPDGYIVLTANRDGVLNYYAASVAEAIREVKLPALSNTGATLVLCRTRDKVIIDEVAYSSQWHDIGIKNRKGVSLERIRSEADTQDAANWTSATAAVGYGTPGYRNSQHGVHAPSNRIQVETPTYIPERDEYVITYRTEKTGYRLQVAIFTPDGKKRAEIANNQLIAQEGEIRWDGYGLDGRRLQPDIYIFYVECYHPDGQRKVVKKAFLVRP